MVPTGVAVAIPDGHAGLVLPRSGLASKHGLTLANAPGLIDAGYRGEVICAVGEPRSGRRGRDPCGRPDRAAGDRGLPGVAPAWVDELPPDRRGEGGFGSTGTD